MESSERPAAAPGRWTSLWVVALVSFVGQLALCQFFSFGLNVPFSEDVPPSKLWVLGYHFPPSGTFQVLNWLGIPYLPQALNPLSLAAAHMSSWFFFTSYVPILSTLALLAMAAFLREMEISRPAALFGAVVYAWQGDILSFIYPGHFGYLTSWPFYALGAWGALRAYHTGRWPYAVISGACCGIMVSLLTNADRGGIASLLVGALFLAPLLRDWNSPRPLLHFALCIAVAGLIAFAPLLGLFKSNITGVKIGGESDREEIYKLCTQYSLGPAETFTYLAPGFFGWHIHSSEGLYWGWIGEWPDWEKNHTGPANMNLAISTCGTIAALLAVMGAVVILPGRILGPGPLGDRPRFYGRVLLALGLVSLVLSWGWHTGFYRYLFYLPLMDKWRDPLKWLEMFNFALIPLCAIGLDHLLGTLAPNPDDACRRLRKRFVWFAGLILALLAAVLVLSYAAALPFATHLLKQGLDKLTVADMMNTMYTSLFWALALTVLLVFVPFALWHADRLRRRTLVNPWLQRFWEDILCVDRLPLTLSLALAGLSAVQLGWVAQQFIQPVPLQMLTASNPLLDALQHEGDRVRCTVAVEDPTLNVLLQNQFAAMDISCLDISAASRIPDNYNTFIHNFDNDHARLWFLAGVKNVVVPEAGLEGLRQQPDVASNIAHVDGYTIAPTPSPDAPSHALIQLKDYLEKATFVPASAQLPTSDLLNRMKDPNWNARQQVLWEDNQEAGTFAKDAGAPDSVGHVALEAYTPTTIDLEAESTHGGFVLINDQYDPDWQVEVNGKPAALLRADYILRAVAVPPGSAEIKMRYVAHYHFVPVESVSLLSDGAMIAAWIVAGLALRRNVR